MDFRSCLLDENEMAEHTEQVQGGGTKPGTPLGIVTNILHTFHWLTCTQKQSMWASVPWQYQSTWSSRQWEVQLLSRQAPNSCTRCLFCPP